MDIHEYQVKRLFQKYDIPILQGEVAYTPAEALDIAQKLGGASWAIKAQTHDDNRFQGWFQEPVAAVETGIRITTSLPEVLVVAKQMLGKKLCSVSAPKGKEITKVYVEECVQIKKRMGISFWLDAMTQSIQCTAICGKIQKTIELSFKGIGIFAMRSLLKVFDLPAKQAKKMQSLIKKAFRLFLNYECFAVELNPLVITNTDQLVVLEGRIVLDSNALFRYSDLKVLRETEETQKRKALEHGFRYTQFSGNIACLVNGTGLGMSTVEMIKNKKGEIDCLLEVGTEPEQRTITQAFQMILSEPNIEGVFINIFGGVTRCDTIAKGLISAAGAIAPGIPLVVRMAGTNASVGKRLLIESGLPFQICHEMSEGVDMIIKAVRELS